MAKKLKPGSMAAILRDARLNAIVEAIQSEGTKAGAARKLDITTTSLRGILKLRYSDGRKAPKL